ncbi:MAG: tRNA 2-thiouridine(34) synthase MnmA [Pseudanabaenaceae cyanobacterium]
MTITEGTSAHRVIVGLSGGVDSSVTAAVLHRQGYQVHGLTFWLMRGKGQCCSEGLIDAARICEQLGIPHDVVDSRDRFQTEIVDYLITGYADGITPLPCSRCNKAVKFSPLLEYARHKGFDKIATGHYVRLSFDHEIGRYQLRRALDRHKDQSYFLYEVGQTELSACIFPLGDLTKAQVRQIAAELGLATANKPDSQDLCLIEAHGSMREFLAKYLSPRPGEIVDTKGKVLGQHDGIQNYTIGQRRGLGIAAAQPLYVLKIDPVLNRVVVGTRAEAGQTICTVHRVNWVSIPPAPTPRPAQVQIRYRTPPAPATIVPLPDDRAQIIFDQPQFGITPGQAAVFYQDDLLLGGGLIERPAN